MRTITTFLVVMAFLFISSSTTSAQDIYDYKNGLLVIKVDQFEKNDTEGYVTYSKKLPLTYNQAELAVTVTVINGKAHSIEFVTEARPSLNRNNSGQGYSQTLWPYYGHVWSVHRYTQAIYAQGDNLEGMLKDLEIRFNGAYGRVGFTATGDAAKGTLVITMKNK
jgi:hypothetical protein